MALLGSPGGPSMLPKVAGSAGRIRVSPEGCLESLILRDELDVGNAESPIRAQTELELRLRAVEQSRFVEASAPFLAGFTMVAASEPAGANARAPGLDQARTGGASFDQIVSRLRAHGDKPDPSLFNGLAATLRREAGAPTQALRMLEAKSELSSTLSSVHPTKAESKIE